MTTSRANEKKFASFSHALTLRRHQPPAWMLPQCGKKSWVYSGQSKRSGGKRWPQHDTAEQLHYTDPDGAVWIAPAGSVVEAPPSARDLVINGRTLRRKNRNDSPARGRLIKRRGHGKHRSHVLQRVRCKRSKRERGQDMYTFVSPRQALEKRLVLRRDSARRATYPPALPVSEEEIEETRSGRECESIDFPNRSSRRSAVAIAFQSARNGKAAVIFFL